MSQVSIIDIEGNHPQIPTQFNGNSGFAIPLANELEVITANSTPIFIGSGNTLELDFGITNLALGSDMPAVTTGTHNTFYGLDAGESVTVGNLNVGIGYQALQNAVESSDNVAIGSRSMQSANAINANSNVAAGSFSLQDLVDGNDTVAIGYQALSNIVHGGSNTALGYRSGFNYVDSEFDNITIGWDVTGDAAESNTTRIGSSQTRCFIDGIYGVTVASPLLVTINSSDQLGSVSSGAIGQTITGNSGGALSPTLGNWNIVGSGSITTVGSGSTLTAQLTGLTQYSVLVGAGTSTITKIGPSSTAGQIFQSAGASANPAFSTATYPSTTTINRILYSSATDTVSQLVTTNRALLIADSSGVPTWRAIADGQLVIGSSSSQPIAGNITPGVGISVTNGANSITISATGGGVTWSVVTVNASFTVNTGTIANKAGLLTMTLPATAAIGDIIEITGINTALGWSIAQNANQQIHLGNVSTTVGVGGSLASTAIRDSVKLLCVVAGASTIYNVLSSVGNITVV